MELEKCGICLRPLDTLDGKCGSDDAECLRIGYERSQAALAAARREIEDSRRVIFMLVTQSGGEVVIGRNVILRVDDLRATIETSRDPGGDLRIRAALAAPAAGEEGKHGCDAGRGIYPKYHVVRLAPNGLIDRSGKHDACDYYVLDWKHDPFAIPAALAYADACEAQFPVLAKELRARAAKEK